VELAPERLAAQLAAEALRPAYLIAGPEPLRVLEAADAVRAAARAQGVAEREIFDIQGHEREPDWDGLSASFSAPSLFASRRLLELRLPTGRPGVKGAKVVCDFCNAPPPDVCLLVVAGDWSNAHKGKWSEAIGRIGHIAIASTVRPHEAIDWIERRLRARGLRVAPDGVQRLAERTEGNLLAAAQEIEKLVLLAPRPPAIPAAASGPPDTPAPLGADDIDAVVADASRFDVFRLIDAALNGQGAQVARTLVGLRAEGEAVPALLGMLGMELQRIAALARVADGGGNLAAAFKAQRVWDSKQAVYRRALQRHPAARWEQYLSELGRIDRISKGRAEGDAWQVLERLLLAVAEPRAGRLLAS